MTAFLERYSAVLDLQKAHQMRVLLVLIIICATLPYFTLLETVAAQTRPLQRSCTNLFSDHFRHRVLARGFVCGTSLQSSKEQWIFQQSGLIHLIVVSGGHLQMLSLFLVECSPHWLQRRSRLFQVLLGAVLLAYCLFTGFQAPVVRALLARCFFGLSSHWRWNWDLSKCQIASGVFALTLFPDWIHSLSFYLSWLASIGFLVAPMCFRYQNRTARLSWWQLCLTCGLIQAFVAVVFGSFSWLGLAMNVLIAAPLALLLVPLSLLPVLWPSSTVGVDLIWEKLLNLLEWIVRWSSPPPVTRLGQPAWMGLWLFLVLLLAICSHLQLKRFRGSHV
jgi:ComEC/Rec2-related protein